MELHVCLPLGVSVVCNAIDALLLARGRGSQEVQELAGLGIASVVQQVSGLYLRIAPHKTEALRFHKKREGVVSTHSLLRVIRAEVYVEQRIKFIGLTMDSRWSSSG